MIELSEKISGLIAMLAMTILLLVFITAIERNYKIIHAYRKKYGLDRTCEIADLDKKTISNTAKLTKILDRRQRIFGKNVNAEMPKQNSETMFEFIKRRFYKV